MLGRQGCVDLSADSRERSLFNIQKQVRRGSPDQKDIQSREVNFMKFDSTYILHLLYTFMICIQLFTIHSLASQFREVGLRTRVCIRGFGHLSENLYALVNVKCCRTPFNHNPIVASHLRCLFLVCKQY